MKIYAVADIHARQKRLNCISANVKRLSPDLVVVAGDLTSYRASSFVVRHLAELPVPVFAILGNTDRKLVGRQINRSTGISSTNRPPMNEHPFNLVGLNGTLPVPFRSRVSLRERTLLKSIAPLVNQNTILVVHTPPWGILDEVMGKFHAGSKNLLEFIRSKEPMLVVCGHIHERPGVKHLGKTMVVNCTLGHGSQGALIHIQGPGSTRLKVQMLYPPL
ncbi:MAG: metallophosphoesterase [Thermodesulfobacteriota bacterium]